MQKPEICSNAYANPACPYITQINVNTNCMKNVEKALSALMGSDGTALNEGVIYRMLGKIENLEAGRTVTASWLSFVKPIAVSVVITAITTFLLSRFI